ncbi:MAG: hypothetical protein EOO88_16880 [Pedobacter sp.]|nr:MAG: hypothetical protein EOO88_16880 [Pedobacter sp.]
MKVAVVFFLSVFFLMLKSGNSAQAEVRSSFSTYSPALHVGKSAQTKFSNINQESPLFKNTNLTDLPEDLLSIENDDDSEDFSYTGKLLLSANYFITLVFFSAFVHFCSTQKNRLPFCSHLSFTSSYKYILQGVLRL